MKKRLIYAVESTLDVTVGSGTDSRTEGSGYYFIYPGRNSEIVPNEIWNKLSVTRGGAMHFPSIYEAIERIQDDIANDYNVTVNIYDRSGNLIGTVYPEV